MHACTPLRPCLRQPVSVLYGVTCLHPHQVASAVYPLTHTEATWLQSTTLAYNSYLTLNGAPPFNAASPWIATPADANTWTGSQMSVCIDTLTTWQAVTMMNNFAVTAPGSLADAIFQHLRPWWVPGKVPGMDLGMVPGMDPVVDPGMDPGMDPECPLLCYCTVAVLGVVFYGGCGAPIPERAHTTTYSYSTL